MNHGWSWAVVMGVCCLVMGCHSISGSSLKNSEGVTCYTQGQYDQALPYFQEAVRLDPSNAEAYYNVASTYQRQAALHGQPSLLTQAENYYRACLDRNPSAETTVCCYRGLATAMSQRNQSDQALALLQDWESRNPNSVEPKLEKAYLLESQGKNEDALAQLQQAVNLAPGDYRVYYKTGVLQQKLGNEETALSQYLMAGRLAPSDQEIANRISLLQAKTDRKDVDPNAMATVRKAVPASSVAGNTGTSAPPVTSLASNGSPVPVFNPPATGTSPSAPNFAAADEIATNQAGNQVGNQAGNQVTSPPGLNDARWVQTTGAGSQAPVAASGTPAPSAGPTALPDGTGASSLPPPVGQVQAATQPSASEKAAAAATVPQLDATATGVPATTAPPVSETNFPNRKNKSSEMGTEPPTIRAGARL